MNPKQGKYPEKMREAVRKSLQEMIVSGWGRGEKLIDESDFKHMYIVGIFFV